MPWLGTFFQGTELAFATGHVVKLNKWIDAFNLNIYHPAECQQMK